MAINMEQNEQGLANLANMMETIVQYQQAYQAHAAQPSRAMVEWGAGTMDKESVQRDKVTRASPSTLAERRVSVLSARANA